MRLSDLGSTREYISDAIEPCPRRGRGAQRLVLFARFGVRPLWSYMGVQAIVQVSQSCHVVVFTAPGERVSRTRFLEVGCVVKQPGEYVFQHMASLFKADPWCGLVDLMFHPLLWPSTCCASSFVLLAVSFTAVRLSLASRPRSAVKPLSGKSWAQFRCHLVSLLRFSTRVRVSQAFFTGLDPTALQKRDKQAKAKDCKRMQWRKPPGSCVQRWSWREYRER